MYYPSPLHWLLRGAREFFHRVRMAVRAPEIECTQIFEMQRSHRDRQRLADEYARGYLVGWHECFHACLAAVEEELTQSADVWEIGALLTDGCAPPKEN